MMNMRTFHLKVTLSGTRVRIEVREDDSANYCNGIDKREQLVQLDLVAAVRLNCEVECHYVDKDVERERHIKELLHLVHFILVQLSELKV